MLGGCVWAVLGLGVVWVGWVVFWGVWGARILGTSPAWVLPLVAGE